jgi:hypothetical protein
MAADTRRFTPIRIVLICVYLCASAACGYKEFTLPPPENGGLRGPFTWSALPEPVIAREQASDVLNPSVVKLNGEYQNYFSEYDGKTWLTRVASSRDGVTWKKGNRLDLPVAGGMAGNGSALVVGGTLYNWYETGSPPKIAHAGDGVVLGPGPLGSFDEVAVADPYVIKVGDYFYLYDLGQDKARRQRLGVARSHDGVSWEKLRSNPILEMGEVGAFDENGLGEPAVWSSGGSYWMLYTGRDRGERRRIGLAKSADGVHWSREQNFKPIAGDQPWSKEVMCDPSVEVLSDQIRVWFGGGDVARPDQGIHGQIGLGFLKQAAK